MKNIALLIGFAVSSLVANAQVLIGVNGKLNTYTIGVDVNNIGYYGSLSYSNVEVGKQLPLFRFDYVDPDLHPNAKHYDAVYQTSVETNYIFKFGKVLNNDNEVRVGVHVGGTLNQKQTFNNYNDMGGFSLLDQRTHNNSLLGGVYVHYYLLWVNVDFNTNKQVNTTFGLFIPLMKSNKCSR